MTQKLSSAQYDVFTAVRTRTNENGLSVMPVAGPYPTPCVVVARHGGMETDIVFYSAARRGAPPVVPAPYSVNPNRVYLRGQQVGVWPIDEDGGVRNYVTTGWFIFAILAPEGLESDFLLGQVPFPGADANEMLPGAYLSYTQLNQGQVQRVANQSVPNFAPLVKKILQYQNRGG